MITSTRSALRRTVSGGFFGLIMAGYYRWQARKLDLPLWEDYGNDRESLDATTH